MPQGSEPGTATSSKTAKSSTNTASLTAGTIGLSEAPAPPGLLLDILRAHPDVLIGTELCENFYHVPPEELLRKESQEVVFNRWTRALVDRKKIENALQRERDRAQQYLER